VEAIERIVKEHPFFAGMPNAFFDLVCGCAKNVYFEASQCLFHEGEPADWFYLLLHGRAAVQLTVPGRGASPFRR
jgi:CRP/FNR family transcriptional regulator, cyclic AMP receptor protein